MDQILNNKSKTAFARDSNAIPISKTKMQELYFHEKRIIILHYTFYIT